MIPKPPFEIGQHVVINDEFGPDRGIVTGIQYRPASWVEQEWVCSVWLYLKNLGDEVVRSENVVLLDSPPPDYAFDVFRSDD